MSRTVAAGFKVRYLDISPDMLGRCLLLDKDKAEEFKRLALRKLDGIEPAAGETCYHRWLRWLCEINGLPYTLPVPRELANAILADAAVSRFNFFLA